MTLPHKNIKVGLFYNERIEIPPTYGHHRSNQSSHRQTLGQDTRNNSYILPSNGALNQPRANSHYLKTDTGTFGKLLKYNNPLISSKSRKISLPTDKSI
jgi:hypothetical protein